MADSSLLFFLFEPGTIDFPGDNHSNSDQYANKTACSNGRSQLGIRGEKRENDAQGSRKKNEDDATTQRGFRRAKGSLLQRHFKIWP